MRGGGAWVELVHDRFIEPIRNGDAEWQTEHLSPWQQQAALWNTQERPDGLLLRGQALEEAQSWVAEHSTELEQHERAFFGGGVRARLAAEREARQSRRIRALAVIAAGVALVALAALGLALFFQKSAAARAIEAEAQATQAAYARSTANAESTNAIAAKATAEEAARMARSARTEAEFQARRAHAGELTARAQTAWQRKRIPLGVWP